MKGLLRNISAVLTSTLLFAQIASACPDVLGLLDTNCDSKIRFMVTGDSIVSGIGDPSGSGYPGRLESRISHDSFRVLNLGVPGTTPTRLMRAFVKNIDKGNKTTIRTTDIDYVLIQVGTNSYWDEEEPFRVVMQIVRLKRYIETALEERNGTKPVVFVATVPLTERDYQNPFIRKLNQELRRKKGLNLYVRFDGIPVSKLGIEDTLHPGPPGYRKMANKVRRALFSRAQGRAQKLYKDNDEDGLYDRAEVGRFLTSPTNPDTDEDGLLDSEEVLTYKTNPNLIDTDADTIGDGDEITNGTDPLVPDAPTE